jgi:hypothetical protein
LHHLAVVIWSSFFFFHIPRVSVPKKLVSFLFHLIIIGM